MRYQDRYDSLIQYYAEEYDLNWQLLKKQMIAESSADPVAESPVGAVGLAQFMPKTWEDWGEGDIYNPENQIEAMCSYMQHLYSKFPEIPDETERYKFALAAYNAGRGNINKCLENARDACEGVPADYSEWKEAGEPGGPWQEWYFAKRFLSMVTGDNATETINYVAEIMEK